MSSRRWTSSAQELLTPGTGPERKPPGFVPTKNCNPCPFLKRALYSRTAQRFCWALLIVFAIFKLLSLAQKGDKLYFREHAASYFQSLDILENEYSVVSHWTTHDIIPVTCYSHNAHGRHVSLQSAISSGCMSIEMKLFPSGNDLLIGPIPDMLSRELNLRNLYIDPLLRMLREVNTSLETPHSDANRNEDEILGLFTNDPTQTLVLLIDFDADPDRVWSQLLPYLEPLREAGFLSYFNGSAVVHGPLTIVTTGNVPLYRVLERSTFRDVFYDAPLMEILPVSSQNPPQNSEYNSRNSYYASAHFRTAVGSVDFNGFSESQLSNVRQQVQLAHAHGLKVRYWGTPTWPHELRNYVRRILIREGVDIITVDEASQPHQTTLESRND
ncbi:uncharacterized protein N7498_006828 [Penicillium cinerascens]|uniref:Altered inheritance of mitochondria protein 6 n=1 Tax=Penicillium cinerascens TaxID=70096 RepID=A0A9W9MC62_9EURO|nr:uncharacterized protein N7498_006828 [Penicillium cinerascens]KAJ5197711.1 hypothetical protein N7498_006828 [Penicillium cinerascens]